MAESVNDLDLVLKLDGADQDTRIDALDLKSLLLHTLNRNADAVAVATTGLAIEGQSHADQVKWYLHRATAYSALAKYDGALQDAKRARDCLTLALHDETPDMQQFYLQSVSPYQTQWLETHLLIAQSLQNLGQHHDAIRTFDEILALKSLPTLLRWDTRIQRAVSQHHIGDSKRAKAALYAIVQDHDASEATVAKALKAYTDIANPTD
jgi:tetratricopeptide (TPR) repeat protein